MDRQFYYDTEKDELYKLMPDSTISVVFELDFLDGINWGNDRRTNLYFEENKHNMQLLDEDEAEDIIKKWWKEKLNN